MSEESATTNGRKRERSHRYPGRPLSESIDLARFVEERGLDGLGATEIASALGFSSVKTNTFSSRLSATRQFGLLNLKGEGYELTPLARSILHPVDPEELPNLHRRALLEPPLYSDLAHRYGGKVIPDPPILANLLYHQFNIIAAAKDAAAEAFLDSARFAGALDPRGVFRPEGVQVAPLLVPEAEDAEPARPKTKPRDNAGVRLDLQLWDDDSGKTIRLRAPKEISRASFDRFLQAFQLMVKVE